MDLYSLLDPASPSSKEKFGAPRVTAKHNPLMLILGEQSSHWLNNISCLVCKINHVLQSYLRLLYYEICIENGILPLFWFRSGDRESINRARARGLHDEPLPLLINCHGAKLGLAVLPGPFAKICDCWWAPWNQVLTSFWAGGDLCVPSWWWDHWPDSSI